MHPESQATLAQLTPQITPTGSRIYHLTPGQVPIDRAATNRRRWHTDTTPHDQAAGRRRHRPWRWLGRGAFRSTARLRSPCRRMIVTGGGRGPAPGLFRRSTVAAAGGSRHRQRHRSDSDFCPHQVPAAFLAMSQRSPNAGPAKRNLAAWSPGHPIRLSRESPRSSHVAGANNMTPRPTRPKP